MLSPRPAICALSAVTTAFLAWRIVFVSYTVRRTTYDVPGSPPMISAIRMG